MTMASCTISNEVVSDSEVLIWECTEACEKIQLAADILLLQATPSSYVEHKHQFQPPFSFGNDTYGKSRDAVIANTKGLAISVRELTHLLNKSALGGVSDIVHSITTKVVALVEAATSAACTIAMSDTRCKPGKPGSINLYEFERARQTIHLCYEKFKPQYGVFRSKEHILQTSRTLADSFAILTQGCIDAAQNKDLSNADRAQFDNCTQCLQGVTAPFMESLKTFAASNSEENCKCCLLFGRPVLSTIDTITEFAKFPQFNGIPAILTQRSFQSQTEIFGGAMAVVSSTVQILEAAKSVIKEHNIGLSISQKLANGSKAVAEASKLLSMSIRHRNPEQLLVGDNFI